MEVNVAEAERLFENGDLERFSALDAWNRRDAAAAFAALDHQLAMADERVMETCAKILGDTRGDENSAILQLRLSPP